MMMKKAIAAIAAGTILMSAQPAQASFLKRLINTAMQAATDKSGGRTQDLVTQVVGEAIDAASRQSQRQEENGPAPAGQAAAEAPPTPPSPTPKAAYPTDIKPTDSEVAQKKAFLEFSRYDCGDCEGGHGYDAWARQILDLKGDHAFEEKVGALAVGASLEWQGKASDGSLSIASEGDREGLRCKQVHYTLMRRSDHQLAERDGLFCFGKPEAYVTAERWVEVY
jgi:hypothetical protein